MEISSKTVRGTFSRMWARLCGNDLAQKYAGDELPLRSELFSADQMEQHGKILAGDAPVEAWTPSGPPSGAAGRE